MAAGAGTASAARSARTAERGEHAAGAVADFHAAKRRIYGLMHKLDQESRATMRALDDGTLVAAEAELAACC